MNIAYNIDCMDYMRTLPDSAFDLAVVDPPYGVRKAFRDTSRIAKYGQMESVNDQKPIALYTWIYNKYAKPGDKILDTHLGSGSSRIVAYDAGLDFVGCEIDPEYFAAQEERYQNHISQTNLFCK